MVEDSKEPKPNGRAPDAPSLSPAVRQRLGYHLQNLFTPPSNETVNQRLLELLEQLDAAKPGQPKPPDEDGDNVLAGPWT